MMIILFLSIINDISHLVVLFSKVCESGGDLRAVDQEIALHINDLTNRIAERVITELL